MNEYAAADTGLGSDGRKVAREVEIGTVLQQGENTYQVRWTERTYAGGTLQEVADYTGLFSVTHEPPTDKRAILTNPIGLYVTEINWGRDSASRRRRVSRSRQAGRLRPSSRQTTRVVTGESTHTNHSTGRQLAIAKGVCSCTHHNPHPHTGARCCVASITVALFRHCRLCDEGSGRPTRRCRRGGG